MLLLLKLKNKQIIAFLYIHVDDVAKIHVHTVGFSSYV